MAYRLRRNFLGASTPRLRRSTRWNIYLILGIAAVVLLAWVLFKLAAGAMALVFILALAALIAGAVQTGIARIRRPRRWL